MKKSILSVLLASSLFVVHSANAKTVKFDHSGVKTGSIIEGCYHNPCSGAKVINFKKLSGNNDSAMLELTLLGYSRDQDSKKKDWNNEKHKVFITCSIQSPTVTIGGQVTILPIGSDMGIPGVLYNDYEFYVLACHSKDKNLDEIKLAQKYGYNVQNW